MRVVKRKPRSADARAAFWQSDDSTMGGPRHVGAPEEQSLGPSRRVGIHAPPFDTAGQATL